jgi:hypothetical protein
MFSAVLLSQAARGPAAAAWLSEFPHVPSAIVAGAPAIGFNPKVNNLANLAARASHTLLLISDSNIRVAANYLANLAAYRAQAGGGLVSSLVRAPWPDSSRCPARLGSRCSCIGPTCGRSAACGCSVSFSPRIRSAPRSRPGAVDPW